MFFSIKDKYSNLLTKNQYVKLKHFEIQFIQKNYFYTSIV